MNKSIKHIDLQPNKTASAFSLIEMLVVVTIVALLIGLAIPAMNMMQKSYDSTGTESMIASALSTARALAISHQKYAGVRFQKEWTNDPNKADQYMIFIIYAGYDITNLVCGFTAIDGYKPMKLPSNIGVMDKMARKYTPNPTSPKDCGFILVENYITQNELDDSPAAGNLDPNNHNRNITDISTFSIVFSPSGKLVIHEVRTRNKDGKYKSNDTSKDDIFNTFKNIKDNETGQFLQDDYDEYGIGVEASRSKFYIYNREEFEKLKDKTTRWNYLNGLKPVYINAYTGEIIK